MHQKDERNNIKEERDALRNQHNNDRFVFEHMVKTTVEVKLVLLDGMFTNCNSFSKNGENTIE